MTTSTSRPAPFSGGNSLTVTSGPEQPPLSATSGSYDNRRRVAPDICSCRFLSRPPAYRFRRTAASRQQRPFHIAHYEASDWGSFNSDSTAARIRPRNMIVRLGSGSVRTTRRANMSEPMFLTLNEVIEHYRGQISNGALRNWRSM